VTVFAFGGTVRCECGATVSALAPHRGPAEAGRREGMRELAREADEIAAMIRSGEWPDVDVDIAVERLRQRALALYPGTGDLFERIYGARFTRLRGQWPRDQRFGR
jgi:hypothetical protein